MAQNRRFPPGGTALSRRARRARGIDALIRDHERELRDLAADIGQCPGYVANNRWWRLYQHGNGRCETDACERARAGLERITALVSEAPDAMERAAVMLNGCVPGGVGAVSLTARDTPRAWVDPLDIIPDPRGSGGVRVTIWVTADASLDDYVAAGREAWREIEAAKPGGRRPHRRTGMHDRPFRDFWLLLALRRDGRRGRHRRVAQSWLVAVAGWAAGGRPSSVVDRLVYDEWRRRRKSANEPENDRDNLSDVQVRAAAKRAAADIAGRVSRAA